MNHPPLKPTSPATNATATITTSNKCSNCSFNNRGIIHHVHLRGIDRRLCTSCVLRLHPSSFCPFCFEFFENPLSPTSSASAHRFISCIKCSSFTHLHCLPSPSPTPSSFLCPPCSKPNFSFFDIDNSVSGGTRVLDRRLALVLLCAAKIASSTMAKAFNCARTKADRSFREAAVARKRAKEALEHLSTVDKARNLGTKDVDKVQKVLNPGLCRKEGLDGFIGQNKVPSFSPQNADKKNGAPDSVVGRNSCFRGNGAVVLKDKSENDGKIGNREGDLDRVQSSHGRIVDVNSR